MPRDNLMSSLMDFTLRLPVSEQDIMHMLDEEVERLSDGAHVRDYIPVLAVKRVRERLRDDVAGAPVVRTRGARSPRSH